MASASVVPSARESIQPGYACAGSRPRLGHQEGRAPRTSRSTTTTTVAVRQTASTLKRTLPCCSLRVMRRSRERLAARRRSCSRRRRSKLVSCSKATSNWLTLCRILIGEAPGGRSAADARTTGPAAADCSKAAARPCRVRTRADQHLGRSGRAGAPEAASATRPAASSMPLAGVAAKRSFGGIVKRAGEPAPDQDRVEDPLALWTFYVWGRVQSPLREIEIGQQPPVDVAPLARRRPAAPVAPRARAAVKRDACGAEALAPASSGLHRLRRVDPDQPHVLDPPVEPQPRPCPRRLRASLGRRPRQVPPPCRFPMGAVRGGQLRRIGQRCQSNFGSLHIKAVAANSLPPGDFDPEISLCGWRAPDQARQDAGSPNSSAIRATEDAPESRVL